MFVGRSVELHVLHSSLRQMLAGQGSVLFLTGEAGLGKTTLVHEWWKTVPATTAMYAEAACSIPIGNVDVGALEALQPWADIVVQLQTHSENAKKKLDLKKLIHDSAPAWAWAIPFVGDIAHAAVETHRLAKEQHAEFNHNPNASNQQQVFQQYVNIVSKIAEQTPLVMLLDDMHWADVSSTNLLFYLSRQIAQKKILVIATFRSEDALEANEGKGHPILQVKNEILRYGGKECSLTFLGDAAIRELLVSIFPAYTINETFERWLGKISDGNSLFVTQFIKTLHEDGHLNDRGGFIGNYDDVVIPESALAVVTERTRRLDKPTRELLSYATAEGEEFTAYILERLSERKPLQLIKDLKTAEILGIIAERGKSRVFANQTTALFGFSHALFHKALYDSMMEVEKEYLHRQCFELMKTEWDNRVLTHACTMPLASKLMTHAEKCGEFKTAAEVALTGAHEAWRTFAENEVREMLGHVQRLANTGNGALCETDREVLLGKASLLQAGINYTRSNYDDALRDATDAFVHFQNANDDGSSVSALLRRAAILYEQNTYEAAEEEARNALALAAAHGDNHGASGALSAIGNVRLACGAYTEALDFYVKSLAMRESLGDRAAIAGSLINIGNVHWKLGAYDAALECFEKCLAIVESLGDRDGITIAMGNIGIVQYSLGMYDRALATLMKSLAIRESMGARAGIAISLENIGAVHLVLGAFDKALEFHAKSLAMRESIGDRYGIASSLNNIGAVHYARGEFGQALEFQQKSLQIFESIQNRGGVVSSLQGIGAIYRAQGNLLLARQTLERARNIAVDLGAREQIATADCELGLLCEAEAKRCDGGTKQAKLSESLDLLLHGLTTLREIKSGNAKTYEQELDRVKNSFSHQGEESCEAVF